MFHPAQWGQVGLILECKQAKLRPHDLLMSKLQKLEYTLK